MVKYRFAISLQIDFHKFLSLLLALQSLFAILIGTKNKSSNERISNEGKEEIKLLSLCITRQIVPVSVSTSGIS